MEEQIVSEVKFRVRAKGKLKSLVNCPPGLFQYGSMLGFRSEYGDDAFCVSSGEFFWGGVGGDRAARNALLVQPLVVIGDA